MSPPRCGAELNRGLHEAMAAFPGMYVLGEDVLDPYGGAFKITNGLSGPFQTRPQGSHRPVSDLAHLPQRVLLRDHLLRRPERQHRRLLFALATHGGCISHRKS